MARTRDLVFGGAVRAPNMTFHNVFFVVLIAVLSLSTPAVCATECVVSGPRYRLISDAVNWSMKIGSGQSCIRGLQFNNVVFESLKLVSPPKNGQIALRGPSFIYSAKPEYEGEDFFTLEVSGTINKSRGRSTIHFIVSVGGPGSGAIPRDRSPGPIAAPDTLMSPRSKITFLLRPLTEQCRPALYGTGQRDRHLRCVPHSIGQSSIVHRHPFDRQVSLSDAAA